MIQALEGELGNGSEAGQLRCSSKIPSRESTKLRACWRSDLRKSRKVSESRKDGYELLLSWFEQWRIGKGLEPGRCAAISFWRGQVLADGKERQRWQLEQWSQALGWFLDWLQWWEKRGADVRSLPERARLRVENVGGRRGLGHVDTLLPEAIGANERKNNVVREVVQCAFRLKYAHSSSPQGSLMSISLPFDSLIGHISGFIAPEINLSTRPGTQNTAELWQLGGEVCRVGGLWEASSEPGGRARVAWQIDAEG